MSLSLFLVACGGGGGGDDVATGRSLEAAYDAVEHRMSYAQVRDLVGYEYNDGKNEFPTEVTYKWRAGDGTPNPEVMSVKFEGGVAVSKIYVSTTRRDSLVW